MIERIKKLIKMLTNENQIEKTIRRDILDALHKYKKELENQENKENNKK